MAAAGGNGPLEPLRMPYVIGAQDWILEWDSRGQFPPAAIMVGLVVVYSARPGPVLTGTLAYYISLELSCK